MSRMDMTSCDVCGAIAPELASTLFQARANGWFKVEGAKYDERWDICSPTCLEVLASRCQGGPDCILDDSPELTRTAVVAMLAGVPEDVAAEAIAEMDEERKARKKPVRRRKSSTDDSGPT